MHRPGLKWNQGKQSWDNAESYCAGYIVAAEHEAEKINSSVVRLLSRYYGSHLDYEKKHLINRGINKKGSLKKGSIKMVMVEANNSLKLN
ncbi:hypothetical protein NC653_040640 [Populus alba x Populus x berolinensis]|uniref:Uncharacterized protein n=1 Tax=Populus alba x Populus x berolinensis TaxID=444605 RepID=A0AAD6L6L8_9ROSI|nr:hypothetical protein NC653_040640 [Populus alba x Populus x berolinensis]